MKADHGSQSLNVSAYAILQNLSSGVMVTDPRQPDNPITFVNRAFEQVTGYSMEQVLGRNARFLQGAETDAAIVRDMDQAIEDGRGFRCLILNYRNDGAPFWNGLVIDPVRDESGQVSHFVGTINDVTASREQLRALAARLTEVREEERREISREIHDQLGQALTGLKLDVSSLLRRLDRSPDQVDTGAMAGRMQEMSNEIDAAIKCVRRIATQLRPALLDDLGLAAAVEWQVEEFGKRSGLRCRFIQKLPDDLVDPDQAIALFRILQEALTNVARHAQATHVTVTLSASENAARLEVKDNGVGIPSSLAIGMHSIGMLGMRERAAAVGGQVEVLGRKNKGTSVVATLPLRDKQAAQEAAESLDAGILADGAADALRAQGLERRSIS